jgi:phage/plasmid-like protein (TIGR03299 family)
MSANIETNAAGTEAAFFSARETPWHRLGTVTEGAVTAEDALRLAHLDWEVTKEPLTATILTEDGVESVEVPGKFATVRQNPFTGRHEALGVVGSAYTVVQNADNADFLNALVDESGAHFETAGSLNDGRTVFVTMKAPESMMIAGRDAVDLYLVATNSHDGSSTFKIAATPTRVVCANTLRAGLQSARATFSTRHTSGAQSRIDEAHKALGVMWNYGKVFEAEATRLAETRLTTATFNEIVAGLFPEGKDETDRVKKSREQAIGQVGFLYREAPTQDGFHGTAWGAYNALTEYADWAWPIRGDKDGSARAERVATGGWVDTFKQNAWTALAAL